MPIIYRSQILATLGRTDEAFALYDAAYEQRSGWLVFTRVEPLWDRHRADPRFRALISKLRLDF